MRLIPLLALVALACPTLEAEAQKVQSRDSTIAAFSRDVAKLQRVVDSVAYLSSGHAAMMEREHGIAAAFDVDAWVKRLVAMAAEFAAKWKNDPYLRVEGFELEMGPTPSLTVQFQFKEPPGPR